MIYEDKKGRSWEVLVSRMGEYNGEESAHRVGPIFWIFTPARPFLPRGEKATRRRGKGVTPSPIYPKIRAQKSETNARRVRAKSQKLRF